MTISAALGYMDFETAAKLSGAFCVEERFGAVERAIGQFMLDLHTNDTATRSQSPLLVRDAVMLAPGNAKIEDDQFWL